MSTLHTIIEKLKNYDTELAAELQEELSCREYGLVYEKQDEEYYEHPSEIVRKDSTVKIRNINNDTVWKVTDITYNNGDQYASVQSLQDENKTDILVDDLVVATSSSDDTLYECVEIDSIQGGDKDDAWHNVIKGENYLVLKSLIPNYHHAIDVIYIDPPYNTGNTSWKYNNKIINKKDEFTSSAFLDFLEKRIIIAKELLNPQDSVLIVAIDEKEYLHVGMLLKKIFSGSKIQMISTVTNPSGSSRKGSFSRVNEYLYVVHIGKNEVTPLSLSKEWNISGRKDINLQKEMSKYTWNRLIRRGLGSNREDHPNLFYPILIEKTVGKSGRILKALPPYYGDIEDYQYETADNQAIVFPVKSNGSLGRWMLSCDTMNIMIQQGYTKISTWRDSKTTLWYMPRGEREKIENGEVIIQGYDNNGTVILLYNTGRNTTIPGNQWNIPSHNAAVGGTNLVKSLLGESRFTYPKSLYAVEDVLRFFVKNKKNAVVLDFFGGSATTTHAVMRLNAEDEGNRTSIVITNNELSKKESDVLTEQGYRPGDTEWESLGVAEYVAFPRVKAAITGKTAKSHFAEEIKGNYTYNNVFPMRDGLQQNVQFYELRIKNNN